MEETRNLTNENVDYIQTHLIEYTTIPAGTKLFRSAPNICKYSSNIDEQKRKCSNTHKNGVFFSTYLLQALAMSLEYDKDIQVGEFITTVDIPAIVGKYAYRYLNPRRHFVWNTKKNVMAVKKGYKSILNEEDLTHFNHNVLPIINFTSNSGKKIAYNMYEFSERLALNEGELFITDDDVLKKIRLLKSYKVNVSKLKKIVEENIDHLSADDFHMYSDAMSPISCTKNISNVNKNKTNKNTTNKTNKNKTNKTNKRIYKTCVVV